MKKQSKATTQQEVEELKILLNQKNRELEIEAALEKVRARSMAMHKSEELQDVINQLFTEIESLGVQMGSSYIVTEMDEDITKGINVWTQNNEQLYTENVYLPYLDHPMFHNFKSTWSNKTPFFTQIFTKKEKNRLFRHFFKHSPQLKALPEEMKEERKKYIFDGSGVSISTVTYKNSAFSILKYDDIPFKEEEINIQKRFGSVFEQTYTRFLDLRKAEAQAREARIEVALERVRSRSMAMHKSAELQDVINQLFTEIESLGVQMVSSYIVTDLDEDITKGINTWMQNNEQLYAQKVYLPYLDHPVFHNFYSAWSNKTPFYTEIFTKKEKNRLFRHLFKHSPQLMAIPEERKKYVLDGSGFTRSVVIYKNAAFIINKNDDIPFKEEEINIQKRFGSVFEQTYTRFLDLQKAEAQAREAQIEASLERVRARSMGMRRSEEIAEVISLINQQMLDLGVEQDNTCIITDFEVKKQSAGNYVWFAEKDNTNGFNIPALDHKVYKEHPVTSHLKDAVKEGVAFYTEHFNKKEKNQYFRLLFKHTDLKNLSDNRKKIILNTTGWIRSVAVLKNSGLLVERYSNEAFTDEQNNILKKFGIVFEQTYTRFLDLQKAEAQAREAKIEAALERVRAASMAMHKSEELLSVISIVSEQLRQLGLRFEVASFAINNHDQGYNFWFTATALPDPLHIHVPYLENAMFVKVNQALKNNESFYADVVTPDDNREWIQHMLAHTNLGLPKEIEDYILNNGYARSIALMPHIQLIVSNYASIAYSQDENDIIKRFGQVFEQAFTRFLDLKKAEAQAREAKIEAALERIRAKALAMQSSADLHGVSIVLREEMGMLGQADLESSIVHLYNNSKTLESWYTFRSTETNSTKVVTDKAIIPLNSCDYIKETIEKYKSKETEYTIVSKGKKLTDWYNVMVKVAPDTIEYDDDGIMIVPDSLNYHHSKFSGGALLMISNEKPSDEAKELQKRAAKVFNLAYQRFLDLQQAEAQARKAQIEAALEKVRGRAMAIRKSEELREVIGLIFQELKKMGFDLYDSTIGILDKNTKDFTLWGSDLGNVKLPSEFKIPRLDHPYLNSYYEDIENRVEFRNVVYSGKNLRSYHQLLITKTELKNAPKEYIDEMLRVDQVFISYACMSHGALEVAGKDPLPDDKVEILIRFAKVIDLTYTRFDDLVQAEAQVKETIKQASLDRVRGEIASMRSKEDLNRITPLIWSELNALSVPFIRCGVLIMDEKKKVIQSYLSAPDGHTLGVFDLPYESKEIANGALEHWRKGTMYIDHWTKEQFIRFMQNLIKLEQIENPESYQDAEKPPESLDLHFLPFKQGMLYVGNTASLSQDELQLVQSLADAFSIAYARYEDFTLLEEAKNQTEQTLDDLKSTQTQLIHAEKMASLGELTAGIAHEIQNPLNFVNNFAEVSADLIEEMHEEMERGNTEEVEAITNDLKQNLQKIHHHGSRASSIVKGMLEHSRSSDKKKVMTDINELADEFLRLAYHGLRAKDKSFNADFKIELDESIPKIKVISQDIGRVLLNLINNAFYAVSKKSKEGFKDLPAEATLGKSAKAGYVPSVLLKTKKSEKNIEISVQDNGEGIPEDALDKIFQPFFTTKPTGQGTGLGLSLSYDIITKGHDGHLEVETEQGVGTRFVVQLPIV